jgi:hypothetical protein
MLVLTINNKKKIVKNLELSLKHKPICIFKLFNSVNARQISEFRKNISLYGKLFMIKKNLANKLTINLKDLELKNKHLLFLITDDLVQSIFNSKKYLGKITEIHNIEYYNKPLNIDFILQFKGNNNLVKSTIFSIFYFTMSKLIFIINKIKLNNES